MLSLLCLRGNKRLRMAKLLVSLRSGFQLRLLFLSHLRNHHCHCTVLCGLLESKFFLGCFVEFRLIFEKDFGLIKKQCPPILNSKY